jgi:Zn ribbon nucleic-acid-binding protein
LRKRKRVRAMNKCDDCESEITLTLEAYGNEQMMKIECPNCGVSYDVNLDPIEYEEAGK